MQRSAGNACAQSLIHLLNVHSLIETTQHRVINVVVEVWFHQLVLVTTCYWLTNNSQVSIHNVHTILIYNIITCVYMYQHIWQLTILNDNHHPYQHDPYFLTPCRHQKPYHPVSSLLDEIRSWPVSKMPYHYSYIGRNQWPSTEDVVCHK